MTGYQLTGYGQLGMCTLVYNTTLCVTNEYVLTNVYIVSPQGIRQKIISSHSTNGQINACQKNNRHKGVLNGILLSTNFSSLYRDTSKDLEDIFTDHVT